MINIRELIIEQLQYDEPMLVLSWSDLHKISLEDVAYVSELNWVTLAKDVYHTVYGRWEERTKSILLVSLEHIPRNINFILLLCNIKYNFYHKKTKISKYTINEKFLRYAWNYAVENGLDTRKFGDAIKSFGYIPPSNENYQLWMSNLYPSQVKSARKN